MFKRRMFASKKRVYRKKKFLRKYPRRNLGSPDKVYPFKRIGQDIQILPKSTGGANQFLVVYQNATDVGANGSMVLDAPSTDPIITAGLDRSGYYQMAGAMRFRLSDVEQSSDLTHLFDQYKISGVKLKIHWTNNSAIGQQNWGERPTITYAVDADDFNFPATLGELRQKNSVKFHTFGSNKPLILYIKPKAASRLYSSGISSGGGYTGYGPVRQWIDSSYPQTEHYGLKFWLSNVQLKNGELNMPNHFRVETIYYLKMKGVE
jgi:hypothetical protein